MFIPGSEAEQPLNRLIPVSQLVPIREPDSITATAH